jgi:hypothetical protein
MVFLASTVGITDTISKIGHFYRTFSNTVDITTILSRIGNFRRTITNTVGITTLLSNFKLILVSLANVVGITDTLSTFVQKLTWVLHLIAKNVRYTPVTFRNVMFTSIPSRITRVTDIIKKTLRF